MVYTTRTEIRNAIRELFDNDSRITDDLIFDNHRLLGTGLSLLHENDPTEYYDESGVAVMEISFQTLCDILHLPDHPSTRGNRNYEEKFNDLVERNTKVIQDKLEKIMTDDDFYYLSFYNFGYPPYSKGNFHIGIGSHILTAFDMMNLQSDEEKITYLLQD